MSKVRSRVSYERAGTDFIKLQGMRNETIVSSFIYVSFWYFTSTRGPDGVPVLQFGERHRI